MILPEEDRYYRTKTDLKEDMIHLLGGRVAESLVLSDISTGASNDLERVAQIARSMVTRYAMSDKLGAMAFTDSSDEVFLGKDFTTKKNYSEEVASEIDREIKVLVDEAYEATVSLLSNNLDKLELVAQALLRFETLDAQQFKLAYAGELDLSEDEEEKETTEGAEKLIEIAEEASKIREAKEAEINSATDNMDNM